MKAAERVMAALKGEPVDRRPFNPVLSLYGARLTDTPLERYFTAPEAYARGQARVREVFAPDILYAPFVFALIAAAFGCGIRWHDREPPTVCRPAASSPEELLALAPPDPDRDPHLLFIRRATGLMAEAYRGEVPVAVPLPPPMDLPSLLLGLDGWMELILFDPAGAVRVLAVIDDFIVGFANGLFAEGASFLGMPCAFASPAMVTREIVTAFSRPSLAAAFGRLQGPVILHHGGKPILKHLDLLTGLPRVIGYVMDEQDDLRKARAVVGPEALLLGGVNAPSLAAMTEAQVERHCRALLEERRDDPRFVLGTCAPDVPYETSPENIHAIRRAAEACAGRP